MDKTRALQRAIDNFPLGTQVLAQLLHMSPTTLRHKANPNDPRQFFSPEECISLQRETRDHGGLHVEAEALGYVLLKAPQQVAPDEAMHLVTRAVREFSEFMTQWSGCQEDGDVSANELQRVDAELLDAISALQSMRAHVAAMHEARKPRGLA